MARRRDISEDGPDDSDEWEESEFVDGEAGDESGDEADTAYCPECGAEIYDAADVCPKCFSWIDGDTLRRNPRRERARQRWTTLVIWALVTAIVLGAGAIWVLEFSR